MNTKNLSYLNNSPKKVNWKIVAGSGRELSEYEKYDLIFDEHDLKIRRLGKYVPKCDISYF